MYLVIIGTCGIIFNTYIFILFCVTKKVRCTIKNEIFRVICIMVWWSIYIRGGIIIKNRENLGTMSQIGGEGGQKKSNKNLWNSNSDIWNPMGGRVQTNFKNSAEIPYLAEFRIPLQPNRTCFSKVRFRFNRNRNWLKKFGFNRNWTEFLPLLILVFLRLKILKLK